MRKPSPDGIYLARRICPSEPPGTRRHLARGRGSMADGLGGRGAPARLGSARHDMAFWDGAWHWITESRRGIAPGGGPATDGTGRTGASGASLTATGRHAAALLPAPPSDLPPDGRALLGSEPLPESGLPRASDGPSTWTRPRSLSASRCGYPCGYAVKRRALRSNRRAIFVRELLVSRERFELST
jgi:hypothetical protein